MIGLRGMEVRRRTRRRRRGGDVDACIEERGARGLGERERVWL